MNNNDKQMAFVLVYHHNPLSCDGGSTSIFEILQWIQQQGGKMHAYTFINFDPHLQYEDRHIARLGQKYKIDQNIIPFSGKKIGNNYYQNVLKMVIAKLKDNPVDYAITCDSDRISLLAVSLLGIKRAHFFRSLANINAYVNDLEYIKLLKKRDDL